MHNVDSRKKDMYSTRQIERRERRTRFLLASKYMWLNYLSRSALSYNDIISYNVQTQHFRESQIPKCQNWCCRYDQFFFQKVYLIKHVSQLLPSIYSVLLEYLHHFYVVIFYGVFLKMFAFVCSFWFCFLFSLSFSFPTKILSLAAKIQPQQQPLLNWLYKQWSCCYYWHRRLFITHEIN